MLNINYSFITIARRLNRRKKASKNALPYELYLAKLKKNGKGSIASTARTYVLHVSHYTINDHKHTLLAN